MIMRWEYVSFVLGILLCLIATFLMFEGSILGENTTGLATVTLIVGIGLIATSGVGFAETQEILEGNLNTHLLPNFLFCSCLDS